MRILILFLLFPLSLHAKKFMTNAAVFNDVPKWLEPVRAETVIDRVQYELEWSTRRIQVYFYKTEEAFQQSHSLGPVPVAVAKKSKSSQTIHLGPRVTDKNFDRVFGHELVHIIFYQKYKGAIPEWLEEGLANHIGRKKAPDYKWLAKQPFPKDVRELTHPYSVQDKARIKYHYVASQAFAEMLAKECDLENLLRLSVGRKMADYFKTYCEIDDINLAFQNWVKKKAN